MTSFERIITTFTRGELSPRVTGRVDFEGRFDGVEKLENFFVHVQGGAQKRSGTRFVELAGGGLDVRLIPFEVSVEQNYIIEATATSFRFYANEGRLESPPGTPVSVSTPYTTADLPRLKWTQSADVLFLAQPNHRPRELRRTSPTAFSLVNYDFQNGPWFDLNETATTLTLSGTSGSVTVTASSAVGINDGVGWLSTDIGRLIRFKDPAGNWSWMEITARTNTVIVTATIRGVTNPSAGTATTNWQLGAWSDTTGWPSVCMFHQGRLWWGRTKKQPQTLWATNSGTINSFAPSAADGTVTDDRSITITVDSNQVNAIAWLVSSPRGIQMGSIGEEWLIHSVDNTTGISPSSTEAHPQSSWGSNDLVTPVRVGTSAIYVQRGSTVIRESAFSFDEDAYSAESITDLSEHLFRKGVLRLVFSQTPVQTVWALLADGSLAGFTFSKQQKVISWHHHTIAGSAATPAQVLDIAVVKTATHDQVWMAVRRTIDGVSVRYIEFFEEPFDQQLHSIEDAFFVDSGLSYSGPSVSVLSGLDHLEGETVAILANGSPQPDQMVVGGQITLNPAATEAHVGLPYSAEIITMPLEAPNREGPFVTVGKIRRIHKVATLFAETVGAKIGPVGGKLDVVPFRTPSVPMGQPVQPFNGVKVLVPDGSWEETARIQIVSDQPLPCTVLSLALESQINAV